MNKYDLNKELYWDNNIYLPYSEDIDSEGYVYNVLINCDDRNGLVFICESGVHIEWENESGFIDTNLVPEKMFGNFKRLDDSQLKQIITILINIGFEGYHVDEKKIDKLIKNYEERND